MKTLEALDKYLRGKKLAKSTEYHCTRAFQFLNEFEQELPMSRALLNEWVVWLAKTHPQLSDISVFDYSRYVRIVYNYLADIYEWEKNPAKGSMKVDIKNKERIYWSAEEEMHILQSCKTDFQRVLIGVLIDSLCRIHELSGLTVDRVYDNSFKILTNTKTGERICRCRPEICSAMKRISVNNYIFADSHGNPLSASALRDRARYIIVVLSKMTGSKLGAHTFRHSGASLIADDTDSELAVQSVTGHADPKMARRYIHDSQHQRMQRYSPLGIAMSKTNTQTKEANQMALTVMPGQKPESKPITEIVINPDGTVIATGTNWLEDMFSLPPDNITVRPALTNPDLNLIRHALQLVIQHSTWINSDTQARNLWRRLLSHTKGRKPITNKLST